MYTIPRQDKAHARAFQKYRNKCMGFDWRVMRALIEEGTRHRYSLSSSHVFVIREHIEACSLNMQLTAAVIREDKRRESTPA
jgi:hypothetical protein